MIKSLRPPGTASAIAFLLAVMQIAAQTNPPVPAPASPATGAPPAAAPAPAPRVAPEPFAAGPATGQGTFVNFNFDQVEIKFLVKLVGELTGRKFVIDKEIDGKVTVVSPPQIPIGEVYPLFLNILEASGCGVVEQDGVCRVVLRERRQTPIAPVLGADDKAQVEGVVTKVFRISHLSAAEVKKLLDPMASGKGAIGILESTNHLIITDTAENLRRIEQVIVEVDKPGMARVIEVHRLSHASASELANELNAAMAGTAARADTAGERIRQRLPRPAEAAGGTAVPSDAMVVASPHSNSLILVGTPAQLADLKRIIASMDVEPQSGHGHLKAIALKYLAADEAAKSITALLARGVDKPQNQAISIEASMANNSLMIDAAPQDFEMVKQLIDQLDHPPQQVLIEVMFAELTMSEGQELGSQFLAAGSPSEGSTIALGGVNPGEADSAIMETVMSGILPRGLTFGIARGSYVDNNGNVVARVPALLNVVAQQTKGKMKILSNLPLWTQNNQQATVTIGKNIPMLTSSIAGGSGTARDIIENINRVDVGIKLTVVPHVNPNNEILMKLNPSIEAVIEQETDGKSFTPTIAKREVNTTITVPDGDTVIISGLIREDTVSKVNRVPLLGSIPLLGFFFRHTEDAVERTNLLIFVTPRIATNTLNRAEIDNRIRNGTVLKEIEPKKPQEED